MIATSSYESLIEPHLDDLRRYCFYLTKSIWDGEDLCQESLLRAMLYFASCEPYHDVKPFLIRVARNLWIDDCRARQRRLRLLYQHQPLFFTDSDYAEVRGLVEWLAERLPRRNVEMWLLCKYFGYSMQEVAEAMDTTVPVVKSLLHRTRKMLCKWQKQQDSETAPAHFMRLDVECWSRAIMYDLPPCL